MPYIPQSIALTEARIVVPDIRPRQKGGRCYFIDSKRAILGSGTDWMTALVDLERSAVHAWLVSRSLKIVTTAEAKMVVVDIEPTIPAPETYNAMSPLFDNFRVLCLWWREKRDVDPLIALGQIVLTPRVEKKIVTEDQVAAETPGQIITPG